MLSALRKVLLDARKATLATKDFRLPLWDFSDPDALQDWSCTTDADIGGHSTAAFTHSSKGYAVFSGTLSTRLGSEMMYSGYAAVRSKPRKATWLSRGYHDLSEYDALELSVRSDGRPFIVNILCPGLARKDDLWQALMFTRGGVYWENIILPFSSFVLTHRGYLQDHQMSLPRQNVATVGLTLADRTNGPFALDIRHINTVQTLTKLAAL